MMKYTKGKIFRIVFSLLIILGQEASCNVFTVVNTFDNVLGSLRRAMLNANAVPGKDTIDFNIPGSQWQIVLVTELPIITDSVFINGLSQPGSSFATSNLVEIMGNLSLDYTFKFGCNKVIVSGFKIRNFVEGDVFLCPQSNLSSINEILIENNIIDSCEVAVYIQGRATKEFRINNNNINNWDSRAIIIDLNGNSEKIEISNNEFVDPDSNSQEAIFIHGGYAHFDSTNNLNIIGNKFRGPDGSILIWMNGHSNLINIANNNFDSLKIAAIVISNSSIRGYMTNLNVYGNIILPTCSQGGINLGVANFDPFSMDSVSIYDNVIEAFNSTGIRINNSSTSSNFGHLNHFNIQNNIIRNSSIGIYFYFHFHSSLNKAFVKNFRISGNEVSNCVSSGIDFNVYVSNLPVGKFIANFNLDSNFVHDNGVNGIYINSLSINSSLEISNFQIKGNIIKSNHADGIRVFSTYTKFPGLLIYRNSIYDNGSLGIAKVGSFTIPQYAYPGIPAVQFDSLIYTGSKGELYGHLQSLPNRTYRMELFSSLNIDSTGFGEGENYLFTRKITTDSTGYVKFKITLPQSTIGLYISSTVTDSLTNNTSEFSNAINNIISGVNDIEGVVNSFTVFPNPANGSASLYRVDSSEELQIDICDITGRVNQSVAFPFGVNSIKISLEGLSSGMYLIKVRSRLNNYRSAKLLVRKE